MMRPEWSVLVQITGLILLVLFFLNWVCTLSAQKVKGVRWGDFLLILLVGAFIFLNMDRLRSFAAFIPDTAEVFVEETKVKTQDLRDGIRDTRATVDQLSDYLKEVAQREMEYQMNLSSPDSQRQ